MPLVLCKLIVTLYIYGHVAGDDFRPTPIPLDEWRPDERRGRLGTLHETIKTEPTTSEATPAHYWEDALRHSVYLTLVRDKIDQLIAKGDVISSNKNHAEETDDQDLWEKIKEAPFERLVEAEPTTYGDVTVLARGRLTEERRGYRFAEDDKFKEKCDEEKCMDGVKAFWSVKRVRQRDQETAPGRYHYELTFSVMSQLPRRKKPHEQLIRTFTVQENDKEAEKIYHRTESPPQVRPERAIWFHKNIQTPQHRKRPHQSGLDRLFSSWFDYDDDEDDQPRRFKQTYHPPSHYSKAGYVGGASSEQYSQKTLPYPYKNHGKYQSHPLTTPPMSNIPHHYNKPDVGDTYPHILQSDYNQSGLNNIQKTTRPAVLPTPLPPLSSPPKDINGFKANSVKYDIYDNITNPPENVQVYRHHNKLRTPVRVNAFPEQLRPPIYTAPPGVFVTMDKKQFKPMPPLKIPIAKPLRSNRPIDFRPSPQVLDVQFSEPDPSYDTAFRPITVGYSDTTNTTENSLATEDNEKGQNTIRETTVAIKKPSRKHENAIKSQTVTTTIPDIITANNNYEQEDDMEWADILGIFTRTTPMESHREKTKSAPTTTPLPTTTASRTTSSHTTTEVPSTTVSSTIKPKKRTRPPAKFNKTDKIKKHKRITTTTTSTTTDVPSTTKNAEVKHRKKNKLELTKSATSTVPATTKPKWEPSSKRTTTTPLSTIATTTTANPISTTKASTTTTTEANVPDSTTTRPKSQNRFRQSTLILKGTSVKHDRWTHSSNVPEKQREQSISSFTHRRKGSNFQGYISSTPKIVDEVRNIQHIDYGTSATTLPAETSTKPEETTVKYEKLTTTVTPAYEETNETSMDDIEDSDAIVDKNEVNYEESKDHNEYIFQSDTNKNNEILDEKIEPQTTEKVVITTTHTAPKTKKCKRKQQNSVTTSTKPYEVTDYTTTHAPSTTPLTTSNILEGLLNDFSFDDSSSGDQATTQKQDLDKEQSQFHEQYFEVNDDLEELLDSLKNNEKYEAQTDDEYEEDADDDDEDDEDDDDDEDEHAFEDETTYPSGNKSPRNSQEEDSNKKRPLTLLELMTME